MKLQKPSAKTSPARVPLHQAIADVPNFTDHRTDRKSSECWLMPTGEMVPLTGRHFQWLLDHPEVREKYRIEVKDEAKTLLSAFKAGLLQISYDRDTGTLTVGAHTKGWTEKAKDCVFMLVHCNKSSLDHIKIRVFDDNGHRERSGYTQMLSFDDAEKIDNIPLVSETARGRELRQIMHRLNQFPMNF